MENFEKWKASEKGTVVRELTGGERLLRSLECRDVDRRPVSPFVYANFVRHFLGEGNPDLLEGTLTVYRHFGFDVVHRNINIRHDPEVFTSDCWRVAREKLELSAERPGFILGTWDFSEEGTPSENLFALAEATRDVCG